MGDPSFRTVYSTSWVSTTRRRVSSSTSATTAVVVSTRISKPFFTGKHYADQVVRDRQYSEMSSRRWNRPSVLVTSEADYSNAHGTPWVYQHLKVGKVVGMPVLVR